MLVSDLDSIDNVPLIFVFSSSLNRLVEKGEFQDSALKDVDVMLFTQLDLVVEIPTCARYKISGLL